MWHCLRDWAEIAPGFTPVVALIAVLVAWGQLSLNRTNQRETTAKTTFREFLKLCVDHPDFADGKHTEENYEEYSWFVAFFLWAAEETLKYSRKDWEENLRLHMNYHKDYLQTDQKFRKEDFRTYSKAVQKMIKDVAGPVP